ncbi:5'-methylthioadenosine/adenosylhomocysteine nucleosidase [Anaerobranca gottschalkii]|uniref:adenosylhomocysteine nucleosidase n=1 Tax=Anaerobranca gottschalkii DSM 13577 TaxID=1120990 RepID=A0A1I0CWK5_9FIRM|nr:5'-methylthioadenosine/adenosylhomocysteine nucleosidase [Anaerobranca gottschalkii]SET23694.1 methylthioadenosine nucleosidase [Anaerobranca gottschalkii DSM 13577]
MLGIIGAMDEEVQLFKEQMENIEIVSKAGMEFYKGILFGKELVLVRCGIGKVNAAICTQILVDHFSVDKIIFTGVAGGLHPEIEVGDIVISTDCVQHDFDATAFGYKLGEIPRLNKVEFAADQGLIQLAEESAKSIPDFPKVFKGRILSGDVFVADKEKALMLGEKLGGYCVEMEGAAVAQACYLNDIKFVIIRSMSDKADGSAHHDFATFVEYSANNALKLVKAMLERL